MPKNNPPDPGNGKNQKSFLRYADIAWRMMAIILVGTLGGWFLDRQFPVLKPWATLVLSVVSVVASMYIIIREVSKKK